MIISIIKKDRATYTSVNFVVESVEKTLKLQERNWGGQVVQHRMLTAEEISKVHAGCEVSF